MESKVKSIFDSIVKSGYKTGDCFAHDFLYQCKRKTIYQLELIYKDQELKKAITYLDGL